jgi:hypothetical protein
MGGSMSWKVGLPNNSNEPITNTAVEFERFFVFNTIFSNISAKS